MNKLLRYPLAEEFRRNPFGHHSPDLQKLLRILRGRPIAARYIAVCTQPHRRWVLARTVGQLPKIEILSDRVFSSLAEAEWEVFKLRWKELGGQEL